MDAFSDFISSGNPRLDSQLHFTAEIDKMTSVLRRTLLLDRSRRENDAEHSWHISVMALLFQEYAVVKPDVSHAVEMLLVHDLVEIHAGDTFAYDVQGHLDKSRREQEAADKLFGILPAGQGACIRALWEEFDKAESIDSKYANCLDRLQPFFHNTLTGGHTWSHSSPRPCKRQILARMAILKEFMPEIHKWALTCIGQATAKGWILDD